MAIKNSITIDDKWIDLGVLALPPGLTVGEVEKLFIVKPIKVSLEVILPKGATAKSFDYSKNAEIKKFKTNLESKVSKTLGEIAEEDQPKEGKKALDSINSHLEKAVNAFRVILRTSIAKEIGGTCKPDDLMTAGSIVFEKIEFQFGVGDSSEEKFPLLDLTKAFKRVKKDQQFGVAWKANEIVVSVRFRKPFKQAELKELRDLLPEGSSRGANMLGGEFFAFAKGKVEIRFDEKDTPPHEILLRKAFKQQTGQAVHTTLTTLNSKEKVANGNDPKKAEAETKNKKKD
jgi:hypothetical protein